MAGHNYLSPNPESPSSTTPRGERPKLQGQSACCPHFHFSGANFSLTTNCERVWVLIIDACGPVNRYTRLVNRFPPKPAIQQPKTRLAMAPPGDAKKATGNDVGDIVGQENVAPKSQPARQPSKQQVRHRASVACASCRDRRIRCVVPKDQTTCTACQKTGAECIIKNDDERRRYGPWLTLGCPLLTISSPRPISKAYMSSLSDRISMLEGMLLEKGVVPPPASHPPKSRHEPLGGHQEETAPEASNQSLLPNPERVSSGHSVPSPSDSRTEDSMAAGSDHDDGNLSNSQLLQPIIKEESPIRILDPQQEDIIHRLLSTKGNLSFDQISGRLRFFGPTANSHVYAGSSDYHDTREPPEQVRQAENIIRSLDPETHDYLVDHFFQYYNSAIQIIDREAFEADRQSQYPKFYSHFLHVTILAMGYRSADMDRADMRRITLRRRESALHREAKAMLDSELERPGGIPSVQALLLLGDLECGVGRDNTGWMYSGKRSTKTRFSMIICLVCFQEWQTVLRLILAYISTAQATCLNKIPRFEIWQCKLALSTTDTGGSSSDGLWPLKVKTLISCPTAFLSSYPSASIHPRRT